MNQTTWLVQRAVLAVVLMVSFYALALGIAGFLLWIPYEAFTYDVRLPVKLMVVCLGFAGAILWAILPRFDRFVPPGPALAEHEATELFVVLRDIARATEQKMPVEVYLLNDVNAFVTHRGGLMGFGSRRVMGIGLPLLQSVTVQELRAILAHEFGHYNSGDVSIGPWIYKTRAAIVRTIQQIGDNALQTIFVAYGNWFLRLTQAVSRRQEFIADEIAARVAGSAAMMSALRKVHGGALAFHGYWNTEVGPVLNAGYLPPIAAGFTKFAEIESVRARIDDAVNSAEHVGQSDPYDTHPALGERIAALKGAPAGQPGRCPASGCSSRRPGEVGAIDSRRHGEPRVGAFADAGGLGTGRRHSLCPAVARGSPGELPPAARCHPRTPAIRRTLSGGAAGAR